jgi:hypothetical protein
MSTANHIAEARIEQEVRRRMAEIRGRQMRNSVFIHRRRRGGYQEEVEEEAPIVNPYNEKWPGHGKRGTYTDADSDGWRIVTKRLRRKRELSDEEMERKWRADILNEEEEEQDADYNGELAENGQRREFY